MGGATPAPKYKRLVIKVGSSLIADARGFALRAEWMRSLGDDVAELRAEGAEVLIVTSGAVALGRSALGLSSPKLTLEEKQACAAAGQAGLMQAWGAALGTHGLPAAQILITYADYERRRSYLNARAAMEKLLELGAVPVVNENDAVGTRELRFGDNDRLSAIISQIASADALFLLSDVDGLYTANPRSNPSARHIPLVERIDADIVSCAGGAGSLVGTGGMATKIQAAQIAVQAGCDVFICDGTDPRPLSRMKRGEARYTRFAAREHKISARKRWILGSLNAKGEIRVDAGACAALRAGKSLLPSGVLAVTGDFERGDTVALAGPDGVSFGRGVAAYGAEDARRIMGRNTDAIESVLGFRGRHELMHRDDMALY